MIRSATSSDIPAVLGLIRELADYERALDEVSATAAQLEQALFGDDPVARCLVVEVNGEVVAFALWFLTFSTWTGVASLYLEDLYVRPAFRGRGYGAKLMQHLAGLCVENNWARFEWSVLDWNTPAIDFYQALGARAQDEWTKYRLSGEALAHFAAR